MQQAWTEADVPSQSGRVAVVTGANAGLGFEVAGMLARHGATVVLACRDPSRAEAAAARISGALDAARLDPALVETVSIDLADLASVRAAAADLRERHPRIDLLVNNAGVLMVRGTTADGFELTLGTNHLGHFALTGLVLDSLLAAPAARIVTVTSVSHFGGRIDFDDLQREHRRSRFGAYAQSKLANLLFAYELQRRLAVARATAISVSAHPGSSDTDIARHIPLLRRAMQPVANLLAQNAEQGALPTLRAAVDADVRGGECYGPRGPLQWRGYPDVVRTSRRAHDPDRQRRLWEASEELTGVVYPLLREA